jgi:hypothetical protein
VTQEIEGIGLGLAGLFSKLSEVDAPLGQSRDCVAALVDIGPAGAQINRRRRNGANALSSIVGVFDDAKLLAVGVKLVNEMGDDLDLAAVKVKLTRRARGRLDDNRFLFERCRFLLELLPHRD